MKFPNAYEGVKKIYTAEILSLIAAVIMGAASILGLVGASAMEGNNDTGALASLGGFAILGMGAAILEVISFIMNIVGVNRARKDEPEFNKSLLFIILGIVASVVSGFLKEGSLISEILEIVSNLFKLLVTIYIIQGIISLSNRLNDTRMAEFGKKSMMLVCGVYILSIVLEVASTITLGKGLQVAYNVLGGVAAIAAIVSYIVYLRYLSKAKEMLIK